MSRKTVIAPPDSGDDLGEAAERLRRRGRWPALRRQCRAKLKTLSIRLTLLEWNLWPLSWREVRNADNNWRHALAALALYQQPFGFTHEDLKVLEHCEASVGWKYEEEVRSLAARIAALLPPEP